MIYALDARLSRAERFTENALRQATASASEAREAEQMTRIDYIFHALRSHLSFRSAFSPSSLYLG